MRVLVCADSEFRKEAEGVVKDLISFTKDLKVVFLPDLEGAENVFIQIQDEVDKSDIILICNYESDSERRLVSNDNLVIYGAAICYCKTVALAFDVDDSKYHGNIFRFFPRKLSAKNNSEIAANFIKTLC